MFELLNLLARNDTRSVYKARDTVAGRFVALKVLSPIAPPLAMARLAVEAQLMAICGHPGVIAIFETDGRSFFSMELVEGGSLAESLSAALPPVESARCIESLARAADHVHSRGIIHGAVDVRHVLMVERATLKLGGFGLARPVSGHRAFSCTSSTPMGGGFGFARPIKGNRESSVGTDIHGLGTVMHALLTGQMANEKDVAAVPSKIPRELRTICRTCLGLDPTRKYSSAAAIADDLHRWLEKTDTSNAKGPNVKGDIRYSQN